jgi:hypothetical protein
MNYRNLEYLLKKKTTYPRLLYIVLIKFHVLHYVYGLKVSLTSQYTFL